MILTYLMIVVFFAISVFGSVLWFGINDVAMGDMVKGNSNDCKKAMQKLNANLSRVVCP